MDFVIKKIENNDIEKELKDIGFDKNYVGTGSLKHKFLNLKIYNVTPIQATILKETALSAGCDVGVHRDVLTHKIERSNCILSGTIQQIKQTASKLKNQQFSMNKLGVLIEENLDKKYSLPQIMGIINLSENSFSNDFEEPIKKINSYLSQNVDIIDIGAESTSPNKEDVDPTVQINKIIPVLDYLKDKHVTVSVDTRSYEVAREVLKHKVDIINDVSFLSDEKIAECVLENNKKYVLTHSKGTPKTMNLLCEYENTVDEVYLSLSEKLNRLQEMGMNRENIILDVGFGFAKNIEQNLEIMRHTEEFKSLNCTLLAGISRKRTIQSFSNTKENNELDFITALSSFYFVLKNVDILRVHNPYMTKIAVDFAKSLKDRY